MTLTAYKSATEHDLANLARAVGELGSHVAQQRERIRMLEAVIENFPGGISLFDSEMKMVICNQRQKQMLEYPDSLFDNGLPTMEDLFRFNAQRGEYGPGKPEEQVAERMQRLVDRKPHVYERVRPNGMVVEVRGMPLEGGGFVTTYFDVTDQRRTQSLIAHMAHHDTLTDLPNRALFADRLKTAIATVRRGGLMAVHYLDMDSFKPVNDSFGHQAGDELLVAVAKRLGDSIRGNDTVARLGGDEFAIIQTCINTPADAAVLARRVLKQINAPFSLVGAQVEVGVSIGIAFAPLDGLTTDEVLMRADRALYRSKQDGRGRYTFFADAA